MFKNKLRLTIFIFIITLCLGLSAWSADYSIKWMVVSSGGTEGSNDDYDLWGTIHQTSDAIKNDPYGLTEGFWSYQQSLGACCIGIRGNVNGDPFENVQVDDAVFLTDFLFRGGATPACYNEGDVDGSGGVINVADAVYLAQYLFSGGSAPVSCP